MPDCIFSRAFTFEPRCRSPPLSFHFSVQKIERMVKTMKTINLKDYYPYYTQDTFVEVTDELCCL